MKQNIYIIYDTVSEDTVVLGIAPTDGAFIRQNKPYLEKINPNFLNDYKLYCIGDFSGVSLSVAGCEKRAVDWTAYNAPEPSV